MSVGRTVLPRRERSYAFALTPLADAMFQLLIFFMLSTGLTPYSLLTLQTAPAAPTDAAAGAGGAGSDLPAELAAPPGDVALWTVESDGLTVGGQRFGLDALAGLANALGTPGHAADVILILRPTARVQDLSSVLAALKTANVGSVQISEGAR